MAEIENEINYLKSALMEKDNEILGVKKKIDAIQKPVKIKRQSIFDGIDF